MREHLPDVQNPNTSVPAKLIPINAEIAASLTPTGANSNNKNVYFELFLFSVLQISPNLSF